MKVSDEKLRNIVILGEYALGELRSQSSDNEARHASGYEAGKEFWNKLHAIDIGSLDSDEARRLLGLAKRVKYYVVQYMDEQATRELARLGDTNKDGTLDIKEATKLNNNVVDALKDSVM